MEKMKKGLLAAAAFGGLVMLTAAPSSALPMNKAAGIATSSAEIQQVRWGWHRHRAWHRWGGYHRWHRWHRHW